MSSRVLQLEGTGTKYAVSIRLTPELKAKLLEAQAHGTPVSLSCPTDSAIPGQVRARQSRQASFQHHCVAQHHVCISSEYRSKHYHVHRWLVRVALIYPRSARSAPLRCCTSLSVQQLSSLTHLTTALTLSMIHSPKTQDPSIILARSEKLRPCFDSR